MSPETATPVGNLPAPTPRRLRLSTVAVIIATLPVLAVFAVLGRIGEVFPFTVLVVVAGLVAAIAGPRFGLIASVILTLAFPPLLGVKVGTFTFTIGRLLSFAAIGGWIAALSRRGGPLLRRTPLDLPILLFFVGVLLSTVLNSPALDSSEFALALERIGTYSIDYFLWFFAAVSIMGAHPRHLERVLKTTVLAMSVIAAVGIVEYLTSRNIFSVLPIFPRDFNAQVAEVAEASVTSRGGIARVTATFDGPNRFGTATLLVLPVLVHFWTVTTERRWIYGAGAVACTIGGLLTVSRSTLVGLVITVAVYAVATGRTKLTKRNSLIIVAAVAAVMLSSSAFRTTVSYYIADVTTGENRQNQGRTKDYAIVARAFSENPIAGVGLGRYGEYALSQPEAQSIRNKRAVIVLDNVYLQFLTQTGAPGFLGFLSVMLGGVAIATISVRRAHTAAQRSMSAALLASMSAFAVVCAFFDLFSFVQVTKLYLVLLAATVLGSGLTRPRGRPLYRRRAHT